MFGFKLVCKQQYFLTLENVYLGEFITDISFLDFVIDFDIG